MSTTLFTFHFARILWTDSGYRKHSFHSYCRRSKSQRCKQFTDDGRNDDDDDDGSRKCFPRYETRLHVTHAPTHMQRVTLYRYVLGAHLYYSRRAFLCFPSYVALANNAERVQQRFDVPPDLSSFVYSIVGIFVGRPVYIIF